MWAVQEVQGGKGGSQGASPYLLQAVQADSHHTALRKGLINNRGLPEEPWTELDIERLLLDLAALDSNNFVHSTIAPTDLTGE